MASKDFNHLNHLFSGLLGDKPLEKLDIDLSVFDPPLENKEKEDTNPKIPVESKSTAPNSQTKSEVKRPEVLKTSLIKRKGRPCKNNEPKSVTTLSINKDIMRKIKLESVYDDVTITHIVEKALLNEIRRWEKANGKDLN